ncbi:hypothetical protein O3P69_018330 [Scylla paramamosain]|uniref:C2H2-type domain-containing protein n=1 Tax=Scylla paramamosain TaxID=85552 RepID=A0AAW0TJ90_SCYPA
MEEREVGSSGRRLESIEKMNETSVGAAAAAAAAETFPVGGGTLSDYRCPACGRCFARQWHLKRHLATHLAVKPFRCPYCPHAANIKDNLKLHIRKIHPGEPLPGERGRPDP